MTPALAFLRRLTNGLDQLVAAVAIVLLVVLVVLNGAEVIARSFFNYSLFWAFEINLLVGNWLYFLGIALVYHRGQDITLDFFFDRLGPDGRRGALIAIHAVSIVVLVVLAYYGVKIVGLQSETRTTGLGIPDHYYSLPVLVGALLMILSVLRQGLATYLRRSDAVIERP